MRRSFVPIFIERISIRLTSTCRVDWTVRCNPVGGGGEFWHGIQSDWLCRESIKKTSSLKLELGEVMGLSSGVQQYRVTGCRAPQRWLCRKDEACDVSNYSVIVSSYALGSGGPARPAPRETGHDVELAADRTTFFSPIYPIREILFLSSFFSRLFSFDWWPLRFKNYLLRLSAELVTNCSEDSRGKKDGLGVGPVRW